MAGDTQKRQVNIVVIEDDPDDAFLIKDLLDDCRFLDCRVEVVHTAQEGLEELLKNEADLYLLDHHLGAQRGVALIEAARAYGILKPLILLTGVDSPKVDQEAQDAGASDYILKSDLDTSVLERSIRYAISQWEANRAQERLIREQLLREEAEYREAQWQLLSETIPYGLWVTDKLGKVQYISHSFLQLVGRNTSEVDSLLFSELIDEKYLAHWEKSLATGSRWNEEMKVEDENGETVFLLSRGVPVRNEDGSIEQWVGINLDITREKRIDQRKDEFLQIASHELKSPIMSILSSLYILEEEVEAEEGTAGKEYIARMKRQLKNLTRLVEDLLDLSKIEMHKFSHYPEIFCFNDLINEVVEDSRASSDHQVEVEMGDEIYIEADRQRLSQVLVNLISNAIKFSPDADRVDVKVSQSGDKIQVQIIDYGIGIKEQELGQVFNKFYSGEESAAKKVSGLGLGLFLTRKIIELHGGEIMVSSQRGKGSTFTFILPLKQAGGN